MQPTYSQKPRTLQVYFLLYKCFIVINHIVVNRQLSITKRGTSPGLSTPGAWQTACAPQQIRYLLIEGMDKCLNNFINRQKRGFPEVGCFQVFLETGGKFAFFFFYYNVYCKYLQTFKKKENNTFTEFYKFLTEVE